METNDLSHDDLVTLRTFTQLEREKLLGEINKLDELLSKLDRLIVEEQA